MGKSVERNEKKSQGTIYDADVRKKTNAESEHRLDYREEWR
jgi:hypothetical protein